MTTRTRHVVITLPHAVTLADRAEPLPPGRYEITTEEEPLGDVMYAAYRRTSASLYVPAPPGAIGLGQIINLDRDEVENLLRFKTTVPN